MYMYTCVYIHYNGIYVCTSILDLTSVLAISRQGFMGELTTLLTQFHCDFPKIKIEIQRIVEARLIVFVNRVRG